MGILDIQRRQRELGRIRMGDKAASGHPQKLSHFRLTSPARELIEAAARKYGGEAKPWEAAPTEGQWEVYTETDTLPFLIDPGPGIISQWYEQYTAGGCTHRCDGAVNAITGEVCTCDPDERACKATTRVNVMLPELPGIGRWRLESHGLNAAYELPGTIDIIRMASSEGRFLSGRLRIEHRTRKTNGQTRKFIVPVIDLDVTVAQLMSGESGPKAPGLGAGEPTGSGIPVATQPAPLGGASAAAPLGEVVGGPRPASLPSGEGSTGPSLPAEGSGDPSVEAAAGGEGSSPGAPSPSAAEANPFDDRVITKSQLDRLWAKVGDRGLSEATVRQILSDVTGEESTKTLQRGHYDEVVDRIDQAGQQEIGS